MQNTRFSFGTFFDQSQISKIPQPITQKNTPQSDQSYKQKYLQCKQNIKQFMGMVEKQFEELTKKHNAEKQALRKQISQLKNQLNQKKNEISNFTVRSKRFQNTNEKPCHQSRSMSRQDYQAFTVSFEGISAFDQSKIHSRSKSITDKNLSSLSTPQTLLELENALNEKKSSRVLSVLANLTQNDIKNSSSLNVTQYTNQILGRIKNQAKDKNQKESFNALMENIVSRTNIIQGSKEKNHGNNNKENILNDSLNRNDQKTKSQQTSVRNMLKNLRSSMKNNIEKESNLEATTFLSIKS